MMMQRSSSVNTFMCFNRSNNSSVNYKLMSSSSEVENDSNYVLSIDKNDLIVYYKDKRGRIQKTYVCKHCINSKTKKTKRLLYSIKGKAGLKIKIDEPNNSDDIVTVRVTHPLYDDDKYIMRDKDSVSGNSDGETRTVKESDDSNELRTEINGHKESTLLCYIYILELEQNKFYVGKSTKPLNRTGEHIASHLFNSTTSAGAAWTGMYNPIRILEVIKSYDEFDEDRYTLKYMKEKGIDNVRGGSFCELNLSRENVVTLEKMLAGADDRCYYCGASDHYISSCPQKNMRRIAKKKKEKELKIKDIPKDKIMKYYGATKLLQNSNIDTDVMKEKTDDTRPCRYCGKVLETQIKQKYHENMTCSKNPRVAKKHMIEADVDAILEANKSLLEKKKK